jgi:hypothetical protein
MDSEILPRASARQADEERRRRWTVEQKRMIATQSLVPGASATDAARQYGIGTRSTITMPVRFWAPVVLQEHPDRLFNCVLGGDG